MRKCKDALDPISNVEKRGILHLNDAADSEDPTSPTVREVSVSKTPPPQAAHANCILDAETQNPYPIIFEIIDASIVHSAMLRVTGAAGPSGLDVHEWRRSCIIHKGATRDLQFMFAPRSHLGR